MAYFGTVPSVGVDDSTECIKQFKNVFCRETKMEYEKSDKDIYKHLCEHGNEENAFNWARTKRKEFQKKSDESKKKLPYSEWIPSTTVDKLVKEIQELVKVVEEHASK